MLDNENKSVVVALGMFDSVHVGHKKVIESASLQAKKLGCKCVVVTFNEDVKSKLNCNYEGSVFSKKERFDRIKKLGVDTVYAFDTSDEILNYTPKRFLDEINLKFDIKEYFCGEDYTFGVKASGNVATLQSYALSKMQKLNVISTVTSNGEKISSSGVKKLLKAGDVLSVNQMLTEDYSIGGQVVEGRKIGRTIGFPTVNVKPYLDGALLKNGVYGGYVILNGERKKCVINYGKSPSVGEDRVRLEAHILGINENLYGKELNVYFTRFIRDVMKFDSVEQLKEQIEKDLTVVQND